MRMWETEAPRIDRWRWNIQPQSSPRAISAYSTDGRIEAFDLLTLDDPKQALPPYDALLLLGGTVSEDPGVVEALAPVVGGVDLQAMRHANHMVDGDGRSPMDAAVWLDRQVSRADPGTDGG